jgi:hypothetical protein
MVWLKAERSRIESAEANNPRMGILYIGCGGNWKSCSDQRIDAAAKMIAKSDSRTRACQARRTRKTHLLSSRAKAIHSLTSGGEFDSSMSVIAIFRRRWAF